MSNPLSTVAARNVSQKMPCVTQHMTDKIATHVHARARAKLARNVAVRACRPLASIIFTHLDIHFLLPTACLISRFHNRLIYEMGNTSLALCRGIARHDFGAFIARSLQISTKKSRILALSSHGFWRFQRRKADKQQSSCRRSLQISPPIV